jgi:hypothetical protein
VRFVGLAAIPLLAASMWLQGELDRRGGERDAGVDVLYLWPGQHVRRLFPGFEGIAADLYWLRTVQYFGGQRAFAHGSDLPLLGPLLDITVTLDPRMEIAYRYGATFLAEPAPLGAGRPQEALALLTRGTRALPENWRLRQDLGFFYFLYLNDHERAAQVLLEASRLPGAAFWLKNLAADVLARGGDRATSRVMWRQIRDQSEGVVRANAEVNLQVLDARDQADALTALVEEFRRRAGRRPLALDELRAAGLLPRAPLDSSGAPFTYDRETGRVHVSPTSTLYRPEG